MVLVDGCFDGGRRFVELWSDWRADPGRCGQLWIISVSPDIALGLHLDDESTPQADVGCTPNGLPTSDRQAEWAGRVAELRRQWPAVTPNLHRLSFEGGRVQWLLLAQPIESGLRLLNASVDAFTVAIPDGTSPNDSSNASLAGDPWRRLARSLARLAAPGALLQAPAAAGSEDLARSLISAGFEPATVGTSASDGFFDSGSPDTSGSRANHEASPSPTVPWRYAPRFTPRRPAVDAWGGRTRPQAPVAVIGAGLAGCAMAWALSEHGMSSQIFETHGSPALEASGNPAGLFHGIVHPQDGAHARLHRAAALEAQRAVHIGVQAHHVHGSTNGLLRLEFTQSLADMRALLHSQSLPGSYVKALSPSDASALSGLQITSPAWWYPGGGWVNPAQLCRSYLERAGPVANLRVGTRVESLSRRSGSWQLLDARGEVMAESPVVVLANAGDAVRLLRTLGPALADDDCPMRRVRGQISVADASQWPALPELKMPIAGRGYLVKLPDGRLLFGATAQIDDTDPTVRPSDHLENLEQLSHLTGQTLASDITGLDGRTAWRWSTPDRLPLLGLVPDVEALAAQGRIEQVSQVPRLEGLYLCTGFGSRGVSWSALSAHIVASAISGAPLPLETDLLDSIDAARFTRDRSRGRVTVEGQGVA